MADGGGARPALVPAQQSKQVTIWSLLDRSDTKKKFEAVIGRQMDVERMLRLCINAVRKMPKLALCDPYSVFGALMTAGSYGLEPNTVSGHAYILPYAKRVPKRDGNGEIIKDGRGKWLWDESYECQFQVGYKGWIALGYRQRDLIKEITGSAIGANDLFEHQKGTTTFLKHSIRLTDQEGKPLGQGQLVGSYCFTALSDGQSFTVLPLDEVHKIRSKSETFRALSRAVEEAESAKERAKAEQKLADTPWVLWEPDMFAKSAIKKHFKQLDVAPQIASASEVDDKGDEGILNLSAMADVDLVRTVRDGDGEPPLIEHGEDQPMNNDIGAEQQREPAPAQQQAATSREPKQNARRADTPPAEDAMPDLPADDDTDTGSLFSE
ncbi:hypothetical protein FW320_06510 [Azospirillum sp. Vi22]|uniref:recombinase RecT n=1 Tax=Azospirillum baldaniorum TaxID=1064539 RepID=UPI00157A36B5|nr:recombinase RecT [Azospirillum baldaniorum]NUB05827.1 hypothetical protein [Azospirillum baldaniorum]